MISQEDISQIMDASRIEEVIGDFVELKKRGANYIGLCPFHNEKTPSFNVNPSKGIFKCFGCGKGGDVVTFLMEYQHYNYPEALRYLANKYGITIKETQPSEKELEHRTELESLFAVNELAAKYFYNNLLNTSEGQAIGLSYCKERLIERKTIDTWLIGYSFKQNDAFTNYALSQGFDKEILIKSGLTIQSQRDGKLFDRFYGRITFPIFSVGGRVIGFSCRILSAEKNKAKYINSPESDIYVKGKNLFGLNFARNEIAKQDLCYLVEGNIDAIMVYQNDVKNVVASNGTALTEEQVHLIRRYTQNVTILYDGDMAGIHASIRATDMFLKQGMHVNIVLFPDNDDPDSFARKHTQDEFQEFLKQNSHNFILYRCDLALKDSKDDPIKKATLVKEILNSISLIPDQIERTTYIDQCAELLSMHKQTLVSELNRLLVKNSILQDNNQNKGIKIFDNKSKTSSLPRTDIYPSQRTTDLINQKQKDDFLYSQRNALERQVIYLIVNFPEAIIEQEVTQNDQEGRPTDEKQICKFKCIEYIIWQLEYNAIEIEDPLYKKIYDKAANSFKQENKILSAKELIFLEDSNIADIITDLVTQDDKLQLSPLWKEKYDIYIPEIDSQEVVTRMVFETIASFIQFAIEGLLEKLIKDLDKQSNEDTLKKINFYSLRLNTIKNTVGRSRQGLII